MFPVRYKLQQKIKLELFFEITKLISTENVSIEAMNVRSNENHEGLIDLTVSVPNTEKLNELIMKLKTIKMIESLYRVKS
ncbi:MAG: ACT domain-containing protein [Anaerococcus obesiensis]